RERGGGVPGAGPLVHPVTRAIGLGPAERGRSTRAAGWLLRLADGTRPVPGAWHLRFSPGTFRSERRRGHGPPPFRRPAGRRPAILCSPAPGGHGRPALLHWWARRAARTRRPR